MFLKVYLHTIKMAKLDLTLSIKLLCFICCQCYADYTPDQCGRPPTHRGKRMIRGGELANPSDYPYIAGIWTVTDEGKQYSCTGALISPNYVLTAAHCFFPNKKLTKVYFEKKRITHAGDDYSTGTYTQHPHFTQSKIFYYT